MGAKEIVGVCSTRNEKYVSELAPSVKVIKYDDPNFRGTLEKSGEKKYDVIYDTVTSFEDTNYEPIARPLLKENQIYLAINGLISDWIRAILSFVLNMNLQRPYHDIVMVEPNSEDLSQLGEWAEKGFLSFPQEIFPFTEEGIQNGFALLKSRRTVGKITYRIR
jgi:NADPH:quinone reductase-like Zn-dependent oxidoreductase